MFINILLQYNDSDSYFILRKETFEKIKNIKNFINLNPDRANIFKNIKKIDAEQCKKEGLAEYNIMLR